MPFEPTACTPVTNMGHSDPPTMASTSGATGLEHWAKCRSRLRGTRPARSDGRMLLQDKVVIVSGVGPGLGQANARALAREGATVVLAARNADYLAQVQKEIEADGGRGLALPTHPAPAPPGTRPA